MSPNADLWVSVDYRLIDLSLENRVDAGIGLFWFPERYSRRYPLPRPTAGGYNTQRRRHSHAHNLHSLKIISHSRHIYIRLAEFPQCYCGEIRQMLTFLISLSCKKSFRTRPFIRIVEYHREKLSLNPTSSPGLEIRTDFWFVSFNSVISSPKQTTLVLAPFLYRA
jgi:hypothetical protein